MRQWAPRTLQRKRGVRAPVFAGALARATWGEGTCDSEADWERTSKRRCSWQAAIYGQGKSRYKRIIGHGDTCKTPATLVKLSAAFRPKD